MWRLSRPSISMSNKSNAKFCTSSSTRPKLCIKTGSGRSCFSPLAGYSRNTCIVEYDDQFGASCSNLTVFLELSSCSSCAVSDHPLPMWMSFIPFSFMLVFSSSPDATACRSTTQAHPLHFSTRALLLSFTRCVSATLSLVAFILA